MPRHIIHKQKVILHVPRGEDALALQTSVSNLLQKELPRRVEAIFDELFPADKIVRIDSLQLNLGNVSLERFDQEFKNEFIKALTGALSARKGSMGGPENDEVTDNVQSLVNALIYFLEKGNLPWYCTRAKMMLWEDELLNNFSGSEYEYFLDWLKDNYQDAPVTLKRLILQFSDTFLERLIAAAAPSINEPLNLIYKDYAYLLKTLARGRGDYRYWIWKNIFGVLLNRKDNQWPSRVLKLLAGDFGITGRRITHMQEIDIGKRLKTNAIKEAFKNLAETQTQKKTGDIDTVSAGELYDNGKELTSGWSRDKKKGREEEDTLYVTNCGVVILHFFLKSFFENLKLYTGGKFLNEKAHQRAVLLLHYLATGTAEVEEFELPLQKILCGYPLEDTLPSAIVLTKKEKAESEKLLRTVIDYWEPLKNTSIGGLRSTFFQRDGKLVTKENGWQLTVEQKTVDVLFGKLLWGVSTIRLPWMQQILSVDWY